jgi:NADH:quinone reductase (non-electrogenic)
MPAVVCTMKHRVVIIGGGFGGLAAAKALARHDVDITMVDRRNVHVFQPLLYQVATGGLSPAEIASPLRAILRRRRNVKVLLTEATGFDIEQHVVHTTDGELEYDSLVVAAGARNFYFGHDEWAEAAPSLKTIEDALEIRRRVLLAFERAELATSEEERTAWLTFVVIGAGSTGVELAGALRELARDTLRNDFRSIDPRSSRVVLVEGLDRTLPPFPKKLSQRCQDLLECMGVEVRLNTRVTALDDRGIDMDAAGRHERLDSRTVLWAAGVRAEKLGGTLAESTACLVDKQGRVMVEPDLSVPGCPAVFVVGDMAHAEQDGSPLPGIAPVAMQQGRYVAKRIHDRLRGRTTPPFRYKNKGQLATIGRAAAVADLSPRLQFSGYPAWLLWLFVHLMYVVEFHNRVFVLIQWAWHYVTWNRGARLIGLRQNRT